jgi:hypothetical protein
VHHGDNPKGLFLGRVGNQIFAHQNEAEGPRGEVGALVALIWKWNCDVFPNLGDVLRRKRVKAKALL